jgi:hypothetical protein
MPCDTDCGCDQQATAATNSCLCCERGQGEPNDIGTQHVPSGRSGAVLLCEGCYYNCARRCQACEARFWTNLNDRYTNDERLCYTCSTTSTSCNRCHAILTARNVRHIEGLAGIAPDAPYCSYCRDEINRYYRGNNIEAPAIYGYGTKCSPLPFNGKGGRFQIGFELEVECKIDEDYEDSYEDFIADKAKEVYSLLDFRDNHGRYIFCKEDGSLNNGFEIVSRPATLQEHKERMKAFFEDVPSGLISSDSRHCGLHVHVNKAEGTSEKMSNLQKGKLRAFIDSQTTQAYVDYIMGRRQNDYCSRNVGRKFTDGAKKNYDRRSAWNETENTIELRAPKGTLVPESFWSRLEFAVAQVKWTSYCTVKQSSSLEAFTNWLRGESKEFPFLYQRTVEYLGGDSLGNRPRARARRTPSRRPGTRASRRPTDTEPSTEGPLSGDFIRSLLGRLESIADAQWVVIDEPDDAGGRPPGGWTVQWAAPADAPVPLIRQAQAAGRANRNQTPEGDTQPMML